MAIQNTPKVTYDKSPELAVEGYDGSVYDGYANISRELAKVISDSNQNMVIDCYPGVDEKEIVDGITRPQLFGNVFRSEEIFPSNEQLTSLYAHNLVGDQSRGNMYYGRLSDFVDRKKLQQMKRDIASCSGKVLVIGVGAALVLNEGILVYADLPRWEIQKRYRAGMPNFRQKNNSDDILQKIKRGYFVEWRVADQHKTTLLEKLDYYLDTTKKNSPVMVTGEAFRAGLVQEANQPFRLVPYFDPGVWGGDWMMEHFGLNSSKPNYAWSFDGVPEENSLYLRYGDTVLETPAINLVFYCPIQLLGEKNYARFGAEFPIRFDLLDTMGGGNLSLQVHPTTDYIKRNFGMTYTQDESYYILDAAPDGCVYLGLKTGVDRKDMISALKQAQNGGPSFDADKYINKFPAKKGNHFLIPAGTVHCSGRNTMVLEISATPYIFTFKLWDWGRLDLNGKPRPINIDEGVANIRWDRTTEWVRDNLINAFEPVKNGSVEGGLDVKSGLYETEFIESHILTILKKSEVKLPTGVAVMNVVDGTGVVISSTDASFEPKTIHYAETFIVPASIESLTIEPFNASPVKLAEAFVRE